jgi:hypothetical protein
VTVKTPIIITAAITAPRTAERTVTAAVSLTARVIRPPDGARTMSMLAGTVLASEATVYKHTKGNTLYVSIPSKMAQDSGFPIKEGEKVDIVWSDELKAIVIKPKKATTKKD